MIGGECKPGSVSADVRLSVQYRLRFGCSLKAREVASDLELSAERLTKVLHRERTTFSRIKSAVMIARAKELMLLGRDNSEVCLALGYKNNNDAALDGLFLRNEGITAREWRVWNVGNTGRRRWRRSLGRALDRYGSLEEAV